MAAVYCCNMKSLLLLVVTDCKVLHFKYGNFNFVLQKRGEENYGEILDNDNNNNNKEK